MKKKKFLWISVALLVLLLGWLFASNFLVGRLSSNEPTVEANFADFKEKDTVFFGFDRVADLADLHDTVTISGWAFCETHTDNSQRKVSLLLKNDIACYELAFAIPKDELSYAAYVVRADLENAFSDRLQTNEVGFVSDFSTFNMKNGVYDMYIYCWENSENYGLVQTDKQLVKDGSSVSMRPWRSKPQALPATSAAQPLSYSLDAVRVENELLTLSGWCFLPEEDCTAQTVYVALVGAGEGYRALQMPRLDVAKHFQNDKYADSGFTVTIPLSDIPSGDFSVQILAEVGGKLGATPKIDLVSADGTVTTK